MLIIFIIYKRLVFGGKSIEYMYCSLHSSLMPQWLHVSCTIGELDWFVSGYKQQSTGKQYVDADQKKSSFLLELPFSRRGAKIVVTFGEYFSCLLSNIFVKQLIILLSKGNVRFLKSSVKYVEVNFGIDYILTGEIWPNWIFTSKLNFARAYRAS
jgi:hypothetical protein